MTEPIADQEARRLVNEANALDYTSLDLLWNEVPAHLYDQLTPEVVEAIERIYGHHEETP